MVWALEIDFLPPPAAAAAPPAAFAEGVASVREEASRAPGRKSDATPLTAAVPLAAGVLIIAAPPAVEGSNVALLAVPVLLRPPLDRPPVPVGLPTPPDAEALVVVGIMASCILWDVPLLPVAAAVLLRFASLDR